MTRDLMTVWNNCLETIRKSISTDTFKAWFQPITPIRLESDLLTIQVPSKLFYEFLENNHIELLKKSIKKELGQNAKLDYQYPAEKKLDKLNLVNSPKKSYSDAFVGNQSNKEILNPFVIPGIKKIKIDSQLNKRYSFDNFIEGDYNKLARSAGIAIARNPGKTSFNPLVVYSGVGLGKTHLCHAIGNEITQYFPEKNVLYVSSEVFGAQIIQSIMSNTVSDFVNFYKMIDVLIIDDIQFIAKKIKTQEIFFHIFNQLHQSGKQLVITSDRAPKDLEGIEDRLLSRFKWGMTTDLQLPDFETKLAIIEHKLNGDNIQVDSKIKEYIAYSVESNIRDLEGVLVSLIGNSRLTNRPIDMALAQEVLVKSIQNTEKKLDIEFICTEVFGSFGVDINLLQSKSRKRELVIVRQVSMYLAKNMTKLSLKEIGKYFGGKDHSTVIYSCTAVENAMDVDTTFRKKVLDIEKKIELTSK